MSRERFLDSDSEEVERLARRALEIAMSSLWGGTAPTELEATDPQLAARAKALLQRSVPVGPELDAALAVLDRSCAPRLERA